MAVFRQYLSERSRNATTSGHTGPTRPTEPDRSQRSAGDTETRGAGAAQGATTRRQGKRDHSDDEWVSMDVSGTSPTTTQLQSQLEHVASMTALLNRVLDQVDSHPKATRMLRQTTQMVREQWMEEYRATTDPEIAKTRMQRDAQLTMIGRSG